MRDVCLESSKPAESQVTISEVGTIIANTRDMLRINDNMELQVEIKDQLGNQFSSEQIKHMKLSTHTDNDIISVEQLSDCIFLVHGSA